MRRIKGLIYFWYRKLYNIYPLRGHKYHCENCTLGPYLKDSKAYPLGLDLSLGPSFKDTKAYPLGLDLSLKDSKAYPLGLGLKRNYESLSFRIRLLPLAIFLLLFYLISLADIHIYPAKAEQFQTLPEAEQTLSLEECIKLAIEHSYEVKLARLDFLIAQTDQGAAEAIYDTVLSAEVGYEKDKLQQLSIFGSELSRTNIYSAGATKTLPSGTELTFTLSDTRDWSDSAYVSSNPAHTAKATLEARQPLAKNYGGFIDRGNISVTSLSIQNANLDTKERIETLFAQVQSAYWEWAFAKENLEIYRQIQEKAKDLHRNNTKNYETGLIEKGDLLASEANVLIREKDLLLAENKYRRTEEKIKLLMNVDATKRIYPRESLAYEKKEVTLEDCLSTAFKGRRDYLKAKRDVEIKDIVLQTKANARWPEIDLVATLAANGIDSDFGRALNNITTDDNTKYYAGLEFSLPIENNKAKSEFKKATHNKEKAIISLKDIERSIVTKVGDAFRDYLTHQTNIDKIKKAAQLQYQKLQEEEKRFKYGRSNTKRLIDYQQDYLNGQLQLASSLLDVKLAAVSLEKELNMILEKYARLL